MAKTKKPSKKSSSRLPADKEEQREKVRHEIDILKERVVAEAPAAGTTPPLSQTISFSSLPLSEATQKGLLKSDYSIMTDIQNACIPHALAGRDILGAARTGSGKTLAFLVPVLECLFRHQFTPDDGPGAIVLSPTRELALQIFQVLRKVGSFHNFSVGLLMGGTNAREFVTEQQQIVTTNIIIATPGRLLQHLEQTPYLDMTELKILVLDEADRILDLGFREQMLRILEYLPSSSSQQQQQQQQQQRQTLLFSATQTRDVSSLASLSLHNPEYLGVHDQTMYSTPDNLQQSYIVVPLQHKLDALFSFIKSHLKTKSMIFLATCAQVRFVHGLFCALRPGVPISAIHGKLSQEKRTQVYLDFLNKPHAMLLATDIASRGLDFPNVDWVVQVDAPEDRDMYIHRSGRTARYKANGKALLILTPPEEEKGFVEMLNKNKKKQQLPLKKLSINPNKATIVTSRAASMVASNVQLNNLAKKAFQSYVRSISLMPHKDIFHVNDLDLDGLSQSLGLASTPNLQFLKKAAQDRSEFREKKNVNRKLEKLKERIKAEKLAKRMKKLGNSSIEAKREERLGGTNESDDSSNDGDDLLVSKKHQQHVADDFCDNDLPDARVHEVTKSRHTKKIQVEGSHGRNKHVVFNEDGQEEDVARMLRPEDSLQVVQGVNKGELAVATENYLDKVRARLASTKEQDEVDQKERVRSKHKKRRLEQKPEKRDDAEPSVEVALAALEPLEQDRKSSSSGDSTSSGSSSSSSSSSSSDSMESQEDVQDMKAQEDMALALIRGS